MQKRPFYITTTLPYVNAQPHIGHALEFVRADAIARWKKLVGHEVFFNTGTDEHGSKIYQKAQEMSLSPQEYVDLAASKFKEILPILEISADINFIRTTDPHHIKSAQEFWRLVDKNGYIYKKQYSVKYCVGCELEKTDSELVNGRCEFHPNRELELIDEENYFFKFSALEEPLLKLYEKKDFVIPETRQKEIKAFVARGLKDFSISRVAEKMPWGIPVPGDPGQVMYVWFDALVNYISAVGWPDDVVAGKSHPGSFKKWCIDSGGMVQYCGKDNLRQQSAMWQAMLLSAGLPTSQTIIINGFVTGEGGIKMSKSLGNVVDPLEIAKTYGGEALRYACLRELHPFEDTPFSEVKFKEAYNASLANGLGNLVSRVMKMASIHLEKAPQIPEDLIPEDFKTAMDSYDIQRACNVIWKSIGEADSLIQEKKPFALVKTDRPAAQVIISDLCLRLYTIGRMLHPILPKTSDTIKTLVKENRMPDKPLFLRKE